MGLKFEHSKQKITSSSACKFDRYRFLSLQNITVKKGHIFCP